SGFTREAPRGRRSISQALNLLSRNLAALDLLAHASISRRTNKAVARVWHRRYWPETNVGAGLPAKRRAGGARSRRRYKTQGRPYHQT
ncbi:hypothetical protein CW309_30670, partial [Pseudomonas hunanensis]